MDDDTEMGGPPGSLEAALRRLAELASPEAADREAELVPLEALLRGLTAAGLRLLTGLELLDEAREVAPAPGCDCQACRLARLVLLGHGLEG